MNRAVIFDLDGTLLDTLGDLTCAVGHALAAYGFLPLEKDRVRRYVGNGVPRLIERALYFAVTGREPVDDGCEIDDRRLVNACLATFTEYYDAHNADVTAPYYGIEGMLREIKARGYKSAIVTNKYDGAAKALKEKFFGTVDAVVGAAPDILPKPAPGGVYKALGLIGSDVKHAVYVGDGETDIATAKNCGMPVAAVSWGFRDRTVLASQGPDRIVDTPQELADAIDELFSMRGEI